MNSFAIDCELNYESTGSTTYLFNIAARNEDRRQIVRSESLSLQPHLPFEEFSDAAGNRYYRVATTGGPFSIRYLAEVDVLEFEPGKGIPLLPAQLPSDTLPWLLPSRYCECDKVFSLAAGLFCGYETQRQCVDAICAWIRANIRYRIGTSLPHGSAWDVLQTRTGVCRDFAHVAVALCRAMNIPTRFVTAHARWSDPPPDFHALMECYADGRWQLVDPTAMADVDNVVCIGKGLDASQVPFATIYGSYRMIRMSPLVAPIGETAARAVDGLRAPPEQLALSG